MRLWESPEGPADLSIARPRPPADCCDQPVPDEPDPPPPPRRSASSPGGTPGRPGRARPRHGSCALSKSVCAFRRRSASISAIIDSCIARLTAGAIQTRQDCWRSCLRPRGPSGRPACRPGGGRGRCSRRRTCPGARLTGHGLLAGRERLDLAQDVAVRGGHGDAVRDLRGIVVGDRHVARLGRKPIRLVDEPAVGRRGDAQVRGRAACCRRRRRSSLPPPGELLVSLFCSSLDLTIAKAIVVPTTATNRAVTPTITARLGGNESPPRIPTKANQHRQGTRMPPMTKKKLPSIGADPTPSASRRVGESRSTRRTAS